MSQMPPDNKQDLVLSYLTLRRGVGILGIALPVVVAVGAAIFERSPLLDSISAYYYSVMGDVFVGMLWAIGVFLFSYRGYKGDALVGDIGALAVLGVAVLPTDPPAGSPAQPAWIGQLHLALAALFFLTLITFSLILFTRTDPAKPPTPRKLQRNLIFRICGVVMAASITLIAIYMLLPDSASAGLASLRPVFWLESLAIEAFGLSWLVKGQAILQDE